MFGIRLHEDVSSREHFKLLRGMGRPENEVFEARARDRRTVVLRFWRPTIEHDAREVIDRVNRARRVWHPMLATVHGLQEFADGNLCLVSEYVAGTTLDAAISLAGVPNVPLAIDFVRRLALGLSASHRRELFHSALHPGNIIVQSSETKLSGRIVAKLVDLAVTRTMRLAPRLDAAHFSAPEALKSELRQTTKPLAADARMNVYSCGCLLHYLCTGEPPFRGQSVEALSALHSSGARARPRRLNPDIPNNLARVIERALEINPKRRTPSAAELAAALSRVEWLQRNTSTPDAATGSHAVEWESGVFRSARAIEDSESNASHPRLRTNSGHGEPRRSRHSYWFAAIAAAATLGSSVIEIAWTADDITTAHAPDVRLTTEPVRAEGPRFPITPEWKPALIPVVAPPLSPIAATPADRPKPKRRTQTAPTARMTLPKP
jgi:serine/threonine protein kinase